MYQSSDLKNDVFVSSRVRYVTNVQLHIASLFMYTIYTKLINVNCQYI